MLVELPLLENEVQLRNLLLAYNHRDIAPADGVGDYYRYQPDKSVLQNIHIGEEQTEDNMRSVTFTCRVEEKYVTYDITGRVWADLANRDGKLDRVSSKLTYQKTVRITEEMERLQQQLAEGDTSAVEELLRDATIVNAGGYLLGSECQITLEQTEVLALPSEEENAADYRIVVKARSAQGQDTYDTFVGSILLTDAYAYEPRLMIRECHIYSGTEGDGKSIYDEQGNVKNILLQDIPGDALFFGDSAYYLYTEASSWEEARDYCEAQGGHLAVINSKEEDEAVYKYLTEKGHLNGFIGLSDAVEEKNWVDVFGNSPTYTNWHKGEPNSESKGEDYAMYYQKFKDGTWNDSTYGNGAVFICEWE